METRNFGKNKHAAHVKHQKEFCRSLYREHLEEASFLYEQRCFLLKDPVIGWTDLEDFEDRLEAHINALVIGGDHALEVCEENQLMDSGERYGAVRVLCRLGRMAPVMRMLESLDSEDEEEMAAISDALCQDMPNRSALECVRFLADKGGACATMAAHIMGFRRMREGGLLRQILRQDRPDTIASAMWALGRVRDQSFQPKASALLRHEDGKVCESAALYLLRIGHLKTIRDCMDCAATRKWPLWPLAIGAGVSCLPVLKQQAEGADGTEDALLALGLFGEISAMDILLESLEQSEFAESAATALNLIAGAEIHEDAFIPEEIDEDELFPEEAEKIKRGESLYPKGEEPGETITRLSRDPQSWRRWWAENQSRFEPRTAYRNGQPYSPASLLENLESETSPPKMRRMAYEELVIRYGIDIPMETDMLVLRQKQAIGQYRAWIGKNSARFAPGKWYFAGRQL